MRSPNDRESLCQNFLMAVGLLTDIKIHELQEPFGIYSKAFGFEIPSDYTVLSQILKD